MNIIGIPALISTYENYIWILHDKKHAWIVDPGESQQVIDYLTEQQLEPQAILNTHRHFDHVDGIADLKKAYPNLKVYGPKNNPLPLIDIRLEENDVVELTETLRFTVLNTPGHTEDHISFYNEQYLFCADVLFTGGCGRILGGTPKQYAESILKLRALPDELEFYCGHEYTETNLRFAQLVEPENTALQQRITSTDIAYPQNWNGPQSSLGQEKNTNPFMRFDSKNIKQKLLARGASDNAESLFLSLREWKDEFDRQQ